jgi:hypothetical protein
MSEKIYWAARCGRCDGMIGYREVTYRLDALGAEIEESLPEGTMTRRCSHCGAVSDFDLRQLRPTSLGRLVQKKLSGSSHDRHK